MDSQKKIKKVIKLVAKNVKDIKNVSRKDLSTAFRSAINNLPNTEVREEIEYQFESYLNELQRRVSKAQKKDDDVSKSSKTYHILKTEGTWKAPKGMSSEEEKKIRSWIISQKLRKGLGIKDDLPLFQPYQDDKKVLMKLGCTSFLLPSLKNIMNVYMGDCQADVERALQTNNVPRIQQLADFMEECLKWFGMKYRDIKDKKEKSQPTYGDIMACFCSMYMDMKTVLSRNLEKKEKKKMARNLCGFVSFLVPDEVKVDVLIQMTEFTSEDGKFIKPFVEKYLKDPKIEGDCKAYLKHMLCIVLLSKKLPDVIQEYKLAAQRIPAPSEFMSWISTESPALMDSIPTDRKFVGSHITRFLLEDLDEDLAEQFLDVLVIRGDEETDTSEETPDVVLVEDTETKNEPSSSTLPVDFFFIDKGKPKVDPVDVLEDDEKMEDEISEADSGKGSNTPVILSDSEEAEPAVVLEDALEEISNVLQNAEMEESEHESESESEKEEEDVGILETVDNSLDSGQRDVFKGTNKMDDVELHSGSSRKNSVSDTGKAKIRTEDEEDAAEVKELENIESPPKPPVTSLRTRSRSTSSVSSQSSKADKRKKNKPTKGSDIEANSSEFIKSKSPSKSIPSKGDKGREKKGVRGKSDVESDENKQFKGTKEKKMVKESDDVKSDENAVESVVSDSCDSDENEQFKGTKEKKMVKERDDVKSDENAVESVVSDSCDSDDEEDNFKIPNIMPNDKSRSISKVRRDKKAEDFMSPIIQNIRVKPIKKNSRKRILVEKDAPKSDTEAEGGEGFTSIITPLKKSKKTEKEGKKELSTKKEEKEELPIKEEDEKKELPSKEEDDQRTRRRSRRKTTSDLPLHSKLKDTKTNAKRKSLMPGLDCTPEKNSKITEYFLRTPIRTKGRVICRDEETNSEASIQSELRAGEGEKNKKTEVEKSVGKVRTRRQSGKEDTANDPKQRKKDTKKAMESEKIEEEETVGKGRSRRQSGKEDTGSDSNQGKKGSKKAMDSEKIEEENNEGRVKSVKTRKQSEKEDTTTTAKNSKEGKKDSKKATESEKIEEEEFEGKVKSVKTRKQSERKDTTTSKDSKQGKKDIKKATEKKSSETEPTAKKSPQVRRRILRSSMIFMGDQIEIMETPSSSNDSAPLESPKKATRLSKRI
ncbi:dentin sialophosphoprotein-like isoform X2 [Saccostrea cucullata]|uniref:dentin sialophosphoprotein-like isoform X2 n=1 Tax=Saccostrea cuccullata TaxID=36930 RepID=UPI002ED55237